MMRTARSCLLGVGVVCLSACWETPMGVGLKTPQGQTSQLPPPPGVDLETCNACWDTNQHPPVNRILDTCF